MQGLGTELGIVSIILWAVIAAERWLYPIWRRKFKNRRNGGRVADTMYANPGGLSLDGVAKALEQHEKYDGERTKEILDALKEIRKQLTNHEARISVQESRAV